MGTWMQQVAQPWVVLSLSQSSMWVGVDSFAMNAPGWIFTLWGGVLADQKGFASVFRKRQAFNCHENSSWLGDHCRCLQ